MSWIAPPIQRAFAPRTTTSGQHSTPAFVLALLLTGAWLASARPLAAAEPVLVYILAGQSNMQGHAHVSTFDHVALDPETRPIFEAMTQDDGSPTTADHVWISSIGNDGSEREYTGPLTAGYGAIGRDGKMQKIGPEFTFGLTLAQNTKRPILIIKTAWGGKSINTDFRPPGAGDYEFNESQKQTLLKRGKDLEESLQERQSATGVYYRRMIDHVRKVLNDPARVCPEYDQNAGFELAGFVWFQGWNDMVDSGTYPNRDQSGGYDDYSKVLNHFIDDVRSDLQSPDLPFVIGVMGVGGPTDDYGPSQRRYKSVHQNFRDAMAAPAKLPKFKNTVAAVLTEKFWDAELANVMAKANEINASVNRQIKAGDLDRSKREETINQLRDEQMTERELQVLKGSSNAAYHYNGSAKIMAQIGQGFAQAVLQLQ